MLLLEAAVDIADIVLGTDGVAEGAEEEHCGQERHRDGRGDYYGELLEYGSFSTVEGATASKRGNCTAQDADAHLRERLLDF